MHSLRYEVIIQLLQQFDYSGEAHASILPHSLLKEGGSAILTVKDGKVLDCVIFNREGKKLYAQAEAHSILSRLGILEWRLMEAPASSTQSLSGPLALPVHQGNTFSPRRVAVPLSTVHQWPKLHRSVYFLADGTRNVEQIARIVSCPVTHVRRAINDLASLGALETSGQ